VPHVHAADEVGAVVGAREDVGRVGGGGEFGAVGGEELGDEAACGELVV